MATRIQDLSLKDRLRLVEDLWDSIAAEEHILPLTDSQRQLLDERLDEYELDRDPGQPVEEVVDRVRRSL